MTTHALARSEEKLVLALHRRAQREARQLFLAEGVRVAEAFLEAGVDLRLALTTTSLEDTERGRTLAARLAGRAELRPVPERLLARLSATEAPQGVLLVGRTPAADPAVLDAAGPVLVLDRVQDPGNVGALVRSAVAFGAAAVLALPGTVDAWNPKAVRAAAGAGFRVPILSMEPDAALAALRSAGRPVLAAEADGDPPPSGPPGAWTRAALVVGSEGAGIRPALRAAVDAVVAVPTPGPVESLNVAVAAGILLYLMTRGR
jgi:TrmH family RNA methyltransferase